MAEFLAIMTFIINVLPMLEKLVASAEAMFPQAGQGAAKLQMVVGALEQASNVAGNIGIAVNQIAPIVTPLINGIVAIKNATGTMPTPAVPAA